MTKKTKTDPRDEKLVSAAVKAAKLTTTDRKRKDRKVLLTKWKRGRFFKRGHYHVLARLVGISWFPACLVPENPRSRIFLISLLLTTPLSNRCFSISIAALAIASPGQFCGTVFSVIIARFLRVRAPCPSPFWRVSVWRWVFRVLSRG